LLVSPAHEQQQQKKSHGAKKSSHYPMAIRLPRTSKRLSHCDHLAVLDKLHLAFVPEQETRRYPKAVGFPPLRKIPHPLILKGGEF
jgi:hypothetical protein